MGLAHHRSVGGAIKIEIVITTGNGGHRIMGWCGTKTGKVDSWAEEGNPVMARGSLLSGHLTLGGLAGVEKVRSKQVGT